MQQRHGLQHPYKQRAIRHSADLPTYGSDRLDDPLPDFSALTEQGQINVKKDTFTEPSAVPAIALAEELAAPVKAIEKQGITIIKTFDAPGGNERLSRKASG
ncbi:hypothetical protein MJ524_08620 [Escherichia coli]|nr:hypothetical protein MJ524_08620 [Escherichia coli]